MIELLLFLVLVGVLLGVLPIEPNIKLVVVALVLVIALLALFGAIPPFSLRR